MNSFKGLFDYQIKGKNEIYNAFKRGIDKVCFVLCMGLGKTTVVCDIIKDGNNYNRKTLVLVHRDNLVRQFAKRLLDQFNIASGIILGKHKRELYLPIQISSRQSMIKLYKKFNREYFNLIIVDEAHYILGDSYLEILNYFTNYKLIGITATPFRKDNKPFGELFQELIIPIKTKEAIEKKYIVPAKYVYTSKIDMSGVKTKNFDYDETQMFERFSQLHITDHVVSLAKECIGKSIVYCINVAHTKEICSAFNESGLKAEYIIGDTPINEREIIYDRFANGNIQFLINCDILTEGADFPFVLNVFIVRVTKSFARYLQIVGRGLRAFINKEYCTIYDIGSNVLTFGDFIDYDDDLSLNTGVEKKLSKPKPKVCPACKAIMFNKVCSCGYISKSEEKEKIIINGIEFKVLDKNKINIFSISRKKVEDLEFHEMPIYAKMKSYHSQWTLHQIAHRLNINKDIFNWTVIARRELAKSVEDNKHLYE